MNRKATLTVLPPYRKGPGSLEKPGKTRSQLALVVEGDEQALGELYCRLYGFLLLKLRIARRSADVADIEDVAADTLQEVLDRHKIIRFLERESRLESYRALLLKVGKRKLDKLRSKRIRHGQLESDHFTQPQQRNDGIELEHWFENDARVDHAYELLEEIDARATRALRLKQLSPREIRLFDALKPALLTGLRQEVRRALSEELRMPEKSIQQRFDYLTRQFYEEVERQAMGPDFSDQDRADLERLKDFHSRRWGDKRKKRLRTRRPGVTR